MLPEDILRYMLFQKCYCLFGNMDVCIVFMTIFMWKIAISTSTPTKSHSSEAMETPTKFAEHIEKMGQGLLSIPKGDPNVKSINFGYNNITNLPRFIFTNNGFQQLETIQLRQNSITYISQKAFRNLRYLRVLDLPYNNLSNLEVNTFKTNVHLEKLDLTSNKIRFRNRPFLNSACLETLILSDNKIEQIFSVTFMLLPNLRNLVISSNILFNIDDNSFIHVRQLVYLSVANTGIYKLTTEMFKNGSYPKILDVTNSPLASAFNPPLTKVRNEGVIALINIDNWF